MSKAREKDTREAEAGAERSEAEASASARRGVPGRRSAEDKAEAVKALLMGRASVDQLAKRFAVQPSTVEKWREEALAAIDAAFRHGPSPEERALQKEHRALQRAFTDLAIRTELMERYVKSHPLRPRRS
jgi:transposase-like protein